MSALNTQQALDRVLIAGAGPVGLSCAAALVNGGVPVTVLERSPQLETDWRASTFHPPTLELLEHVGIVHQMLNLGLPVQHWQFRDRNNGVVAEFDLDMLREDTRYPIRLQLNQQVVARLLLERLEAHPLAEVRFGARVDGFTTKPRGVEVEVNASRGTEAIHGRFLVGADGASSTVRKTLVLAFEGTTYKDRYLIVSTHLPFEEFLNDLAPVAYFFGPEEWFFILRTPESWRILFPIPETESDEEALSDELIRRRVSGVIHADCDYEILDRQLYTVHQRVAERFREGNVLLMGDAAHVNSPIGGMGLNSGIHDAFDAAARLIRRWHDDADVEAELNTYSETRRRVALEYIRQITHQNTMRLQETNEQKRMREQQELAAMAADPARAREFLLRSSMISAVRAQGIGAPPKERIHS